MSGEILTYDTIRRAMGKLEWMTGAPPVALHVGPCTIEQLGAEVVTDECGQLRYGGVPVYIQPWLPPGSITPEFHSPGQIYGKGAPEIMEGAIDSPPEKQRIHPLYRLGRHA